MWDSKNLLSLPSGYLETAVNGPRAAHQHDIARDSGASLTCVITMMKGRSGPKSVRR